MFVFANLSITIKSKQFAGKKYRVPYFLKKQRNKESKFLLDIPQSKQKKMNNQQYQVFLMYRKKILQNETTGEALC